MSEIYLDNSATTVCYEEVADLVKKVMLEDYGNPSSMHLKGVAGERYVKQAKDIFAKLLKVQEKEIFFTSGGTESDNLAIIGGAQANHRRGKHLITTKVEHPAVLQTMKQLEKEGFEVSYLSVDKEGLISLEELRKSLREDTILVSIMHTNNEVGAQMPIAEAGKIIKEYNPEILFHVDAVQGFGKSRIYPRKMNIDLLSVSSHKIHGPKGMGVLYKNEKAKILPISYGGGQQNGYRNGTENVPGIAGMGKAAELIYKGFDSDIEKLYELKELFVSGVSEIEGTHLNGPKGREGAPHIVSVAFPGIRSEVLLHTLEDRDIFVSAGSACASHKPQPSATLTAMGEPKEIIESTIRFSFSSFTTQEHIEETIKVLKEAVPLLKKYTRK